MTILDAPSTSELVALVERLVRGPLAKDVHLVDHGEADGLPFVVLACPTEVVCEHAMMSLAAHSRTELSEWRNRWRPGYDFPYSLRVRELREEPYDD